jgi:hypothetical protein
MLIATISYIAPTRGVDRRTVRGWFDVRSENRQAGGMLTRTMAAVVLVRQELGLLLLRLGGSRT